MDLITDASQIWKRFPVNYNPTTHELTWSYSKLSDMYNKLYKERRRENYIKMQEDILHTLFTALNLSSIRYNRTKKGFFLNSHVAYINIANSDSLSHTLSILKDPVRFSPIIPLYKEGVLQNRSDICKASNQSVCIKYIHTNELGPPQYKVCWNWNVKKDPFLQSLIERNKDAGQWNILPGDSRTLCILEQY
jgi:hypothetical protein